MRILFFAQLRGAVGSDQGEVAADGINQNQLWRLLEERWPALSAHRATTRLARNGVYAGPDDIFRSGDEVALIPPVSGG
ncbi:MAG: MoaD/ThiS family protein [Chthoniobacterales bacterium]